MRVGIQELKRLLRGWDVRVIQQLGYSLVDRDLTADDRQMALDRTVKLKARPGFWGGEVNMQIVGCASRGARSHMFAIFIFFVLN